jgi:hypothetical protein
MDTVSLHQFSSDLRSDIAERIRAEELTPGRIVATGTWKEHVVVELPKRLNGHTTTLVLALRHLAGGHTVRPYYPGGHSIVRVYRKSLPEALLADVPFVPPCVIPDEPAVGDRVVMHWRAKGHHPYVHEWDGEHWRSPAIAKDGHPQAERRSTMAVRAFVRLTDTPIQYGWYAYEPAKGA